MATVIVAGVLMFCVTARFILVVFVILTVFVPMVPMLLVLVTVVVLMFMIAFMVPMIVAMMIFVTMVCVLVVSMIMAVRRGRFASLAGYQVHATLGAAARLILDNIRMHGADIFDPGMQDRRVEIPGRDRKGTFSQCPLQPVNRAGQFLLRETCGNIGAR